MKASEHQLDGAGAKSLQSRPALTIYHSFQPPRRCPDFPIHYWCWIELFRPCWFDRRTRASFSNLIRSNSLVQRGDGGAEFLLTYMPKDRNERRFFQDFPAGCA